MKPAFSNLCSSAAIALRLGSLNRQRGCLTGLAFGSTLSACSMSSLGTPGMLIRLKRIYNFSCSMLVFTPFALCFVTLRGVFMHFLELTY
jgi:hypothetical protein